MLEAFASNSTSSYYHFVIPASGSGNIFIDLRNFTYLINGGQLTSLATTCTHHLFFISILLVAKNFSFTFKSIGRANFIQVGLEVSIYVLQH